MSTTRVLEPEQRIIEATLACIAEHGITGVTMREIARSAKVAPQTLYNHFADIPSIVDRALSQHVDAAISELEKALAFVDSPSEIVRQLVRQVASISTAHGPDRRLAATVGFDLDRFDEALDDHILGAITAGVATGAFREDLDHEVDVALVRQLLDGVAGLVAASPSEAARIVAVASRTVFAALGEKVTT